VSLASCWGNQTRAFPHQPAGQTDLSPAAAVGATAQSDHSALVHHYRAGFGWDLRGGHLVPKHPPLKGAFRFVIFLSDKTSAANF
jgi:hypothetical protein